MLYFTGQKTVSGITRITGYVNGISASTNVTSVTSCYFRPLSEAESSNNGFQYGIAHQAIFEIGSDVREQDRITIAGTVYTVKSVAIHDRGNYTQYVKATVIKGEA